MTGKTRKVSAKPVTTHVRVRRASIQKLRLAIVASGGPTRGSLLRECSQALEERADELMKDIGDGTCSALLRSTHENQKAETQHDPKG